jgi:hypothetical protein
MTTEELKMQKALGLCPIDAELHSCPKCKEMLPCIDIFYNTGWSTPFHVYTCHQCGERW